MRHYSAKQRQSDGRWDYTCGSHPTGYCRKYEPLPEDGSGYLSPEQAKAHNEKMAAFAANFHTDGHATKGEACECYKRYKLDTQLRLQTEEPDNASSQHRCQACNKFTACHATVGAYQIFTLCPEHQTRAEVEKLLKVGESWES